MMRLETTTMAHLWLHMLAKGWSPSPYEYGLLVAETIGGRVWAAVDAGGTPQVIGGVFAGRCWLSFVPGAGRHLLRLVRIMDDVRAREQRAGLTNPICVVRDDNPAGQRLARLLGFAPTTAATGSKRDWRINA